MTRAFGFSDNAEAGRDLSLRTTPSVGRLDGPRIGAARHLPQRLRRQL